MNNFRIASKRQTAAAILRWIVITFMLFDAVLKVIAPEPVVRSTVGELGYRPAHIAVLGCAALIPTLLLIFARTRLIAAITLTAYLGGAVASNLRIDSPLFSHILFPVYIGALMWLSIGLQCDAPHFFGSRIHSDQDNARRVG